MKSWASPIPGKSIVDIPDDELNFTVNEESEMATGSILKTAAETPVGRELKGMKAHSEEKNIEESVFKRRVFRRKEEAGTPEGKSAGKM